MDKLMLEEHLTQGLAAIELGEQHIADQKALITRLEAEGRDTNQAIKLLNAFEGSQVEHIAHRDEILRLLKE